MNLAPGKLILIKVFLVFLIRICFSTTVTKNDILASSLARLVAYLKDEFGEFGDPLRNLLTFLVNWTSFISFSLFLSIRKSSTQLHLSISNLLRGSLTSSTQKQIDNRMTLGSV